MKATGIVRRIDNLGRVVIPKEIRRTMRINEGAMLEIFTSGDQVIFKKYSALESMSTVAIDILEAIYRIHKVPVIACDNDKVIAVKGISKEEIVNRRITTDLEDIIMRRKTYAHSESCDSFCLPVEGCERYALACAPVIASGDAVGALLLLSDDNDTASTATDTHIALVQTFAAYLGEQLSD